MDPALGILLILESIIMSREEDYVKQVLIPRSGVFIAICLFIWTGWIILGFLKLYLVILLYLVYLLYSPTVLSL